MRIRQTTKCVVGTVCLVCGVTRFALCQRVDLQLQKDNLAIAGGYVSNPDGSGPGGIVGYCFGGRVDASISLSYISLTTPYPYYWLTPRVVSGPAYAMEFAAHILKKDSSGQNFGVDLITGFMECSYYGSPEPTHPGIFDDIGRLCYAVSVQRDFNISPVISICTSARLEYHTGFHVLSLDLSDRVANDISEIAIDLGCPLSISNTSGQTWVIEPSLYIGKRIGLSFMTGYIFR